MNKTFVIKHALDEFRIIRNNKKLEYYNNIKDFKMYIKNNDLSEEDKEKIEDALLNKFAHYRAPEELKFTEDTYELYLSTEVIRVLSILLAKFPEVKFPINRSPLIDIAYLIADSKEKQETQNIAKWTVVFYKHLERYCYRLHKEYLEEIEDIIYAFLFGKNLPTFNEQVATAVKKYYPPPPMLVPDEDILAILEEKY